MTGSVAPEHVEGHAKTQPLHRNTGLVEKVALRNGPWCIPGPGGPAVPTNRYTLKVAGEHSTTFLNAEVYPCPRVVLKAPPPPCPKGWIRTADNRMRRSPPPP